MIAISENTSKYEISDCKEDTYSTSANLFACKPTTFPKEPPSCFFQEFDEISQIDIKNNSW